jgi:transposase
MTEQHIEVITSVERRRVVSDVARSAGIHVSQLFRWRKELCQMSAPSLPPFVPIEVVTALPPPDPVEPAPRARKKTSIVTIELGRGRRIRVDSDVDTEALGRILDVVERR